MDQEAVESPVGRDHVLFYYISHDWGWKTLFPDRNYTVRMLNCKLCDFQTIFLVSKAKRLFLYICCILWNIYNSRNEAQPKFRSSKRWAKRFLSLLSYCAALKMVRAAFLSHWSSYLNQSYQYFFSCYTDGPGRGEACLVGKRNNLDKSRWSLFLLSGGDIASMLLRSFTQEFVRNKPIRMPTEQPGCNLQTSVARALVESVPQPLRSETPAPRQRWI